MKIHVICVIGKIHRSFWSSRYQNYNTKCVSTPKNHRKQTFLNISQHFSTFLKIYEILRKSNCDMNISSKSSFISLRKSQDYECNSIFFSLKFIQFASFERYLGPLDILDIKTITQMRLYTEKLLITDVS